MRNIRSDLQERANIIEEQVRGIYAHFENVVQQLQSERDARVAELRGTHAMINKLIEFESTFADNVVPLDNSAPQRPSLSDRIKAANS
jgi:hypothetical protein